MLRQTIFALSSGSPPAAIAVVRISGAAAFEAVQALAGTLPQPRRATLLPLRDSTTGELLDNALVLIFPGPNSATGEDIAELHLHGGRSVVRAVLAALAALNGFREAQPGEFTRQAFENGRMDLAEAEGLADLLSAETQSQRRAALALAGGALSRMIELWQKSLLLIAAQVEAVLDFSDEDDVEEELSPDVSGSLDSLVAEIEAVLERPGAERLRDGIRVVIAGPPNAGKSSLFNQLVGREAAITSSVPGTTRDLVEAPISLDGVPFLLTDSAGLRNAAEEVEGIGIERARRAMATADIVLWLGEPDPSAESRYIRVHSKADLSLPMDHTNYDVSVSSVTRAGIEDVVSMLIERSTALLPGEGEVTANARHRAALGECLIHLHGAQQSSDVLLVSEELRLARVALDRITGRAGVDDMLDSLFGQFCIGK